MWSILKTNIQVTHLWLNIYGMDSETILYLSDALTA